MSDRVLRSVNERQPRKSRKTKRLKQSYVSMLLWMTSKTTLINIDDFPGACSDKRINRRVSELRELKNTLDAAYNKVRSTAVSHVSATI